MVRPCASPHTAHIVSTGTLFVAMTNVCACGVLCVCLHRCTAGDPRETLGLSAEPFSGCCAQSPPSPTARPRGERRREARSRSPAAGNDHRGAAGETEAEPDAQEGGGDSGSGGSLAESLSAVEEGRRTARRGLDQVHQGAGPLRRTALHRKLLAAEGWPDRYRG